MLPWLIFEMLRNSPSTPMSDRGVGRVQGFIFGAVVASVVGVVVGIAEAEKWRHDAVAHNAAEYDTVTGVWRWKQTATVRE